MLPLAVKVSGWRPMRLAWPAFVISRFEMRMIAWSLDKLGDDSSASGSLLCFVKRIFLILIAIIIVHCSRMQFPENQCLYSSSLPDKNYSAELFRTNLGTIHSRKTALRNKLTRIERTGACWLFKGQPATVLIASKHDVSR